MKLLFISTMAGASWGGSEELWVKSADYALEKGNEVIISIYNWGELHPKIQQLKNKGAIIESRRKVYYGNSILNRVQGLVVRKIFEAKKILSLKKYKPDAIIISQGTIYECMYPEYIKLHTITNSKLIIITQANSEYETLPVQCFKIGKKLFGCAKRLYFVSKRNQLVAERQLAMRFTNAETISNPANLNSYELCDWNLEENINFAFVGRLNSSVKGIGVLLQILGGVDWKERNWKLNIYGTGDDETYLKELVNLYKLVDKVFFNGFIDNVRDIWSHNHVLLVPSTLEGTPLVLIEAMFCRRCAVVSDVGGNAELIENYINGFVAEAPSVYSFGRSMELMWTNKDKLKIMGEESYKKVQKNVDINSHKKIIDNLNMEYAN